MDSTWTGFHELLAINPYEMLPKLYALPDGDRDRRARFDDSQPHTYSVAERAYVGAIHGEPQAVVVSGESGSGKTETNKHMLAFLRWRSSGACNASEQAAAERISSGIEVANRVLETLGNAKTTHNDNSSRFGKYMEVYLRPSGAIGRAVFKCFLLERSRIVRQATGERNFHVFYALLGGAPQQVIDPLGLSSREGAHVFAPGAAGASASTAFTELDADLAACGVELKTEVAALLAAILHLGDIDFNVDGADGNGRARAPSSTAARKRAESGPAHIAGGKSRKALGQAAAHLGVTTAVLEERLTSRTLSVGKEDVVVPLPPEEAATERDAIAKATYQRLFLLIVLKLRTLLEGDEHSAADTDASRCIGLLDVFGFESLETNSLEQLCINFANERLHNLFVNHVFAGCPDELLSVLSDAAVVGSIDNAECVTTISTPPDGILELLDHQCRAPRGSEEKFFLAVNRVHSNKERPYCVSPRLTRTCTHDASSGFIVKHFAGDVMYTSGTWLVINSARQPACTPRPSCSQCPCARPSVRTAWRSGSTHSAQRGRPFHARVDDSLQNTRWLTHATKALTAELFSNQALQTNGREPGKDRPRAQTNATFASVGGRFATDLAALVQQLTEQHISFIRCMKPNLAKQPRLFDARYVRSRVRAAGSLAALRFTKRLQLLAVVKLSTLERLKPFLKGRSGLPAELHRAIEGASGGEGGKGEEQAAGAYFARQLLLACGLPTSAFRIGGDGLTIASADLRFLSEMQSVGSSVDAKVSEQLVGLIEAATANQKQSGASTSYTRQKTERETAVSAARGLAQGAASVVAAGSIRASEGVGVDLSPRPPPVHVAPSASGPTVGMPPPAVPSPVTPVSKISKELAKEEDMRVEEVEDAATAGDVDDDDDDVEGWRRYTAELEAAKARAEARAKAGEAAKVAVKFRLTAMEATLRKAKAEIERLREELSQKDAALVEKSSQLEWVQEQVTVKDGQLATLRKQTNSVPATSASAMGAKAGSSFASAFIRPPPPSAGSSAPAPAPAGGAGGAGMACFFAAKARSRANIDIAE